METDSIDTGMSLSGHKYFVGGTYHARVCARICVCTRACVSYTVILRAPTLAHLARVAVRQPCEICCKVAIKKTTGVRAQSAGYMHLAAPGASLPPLPPGWTRVLRQSSGKKHALFLFFFFHTGGVYQEKNRPRVGGVVLSGRV